MQLEDEQYELLSRFVEAHLGTPREKRGAFTAILPRGQWQTTFFNSGEPSLSFQGSGRDAEILARADLLLKSSSNGSVTFLVLQQGIEVYQKRRESFKSSQAGKEKGGKRPLIFICHSSKNKAFVRELAKQLKGDGVESWVDELEIRIGDSIHQKINDGLAHSDFFAIVLSRASVKSRWVNDELASASAMEKYSQRGVLILPILIEECDIPPLLLDRRYANFKDDPDSAYKELIDSILHHFEKKHPEVNVESLKVVEPSQVRDKSIVFDPSRVQEMPPRHFEELVASVLQDSGYTVRLSPLTRDGGYDIVASRQANLPGLGPEKILVQCKQWKNTVGVRPVRELVFLKSKAGVTRVILVTTSRFTSEAKREADRHGVDLVDGEALAAWMQSVKKGSVNREAANPGLNRTDTAPSRGPAG